MGDDALRAAQSPTLPEEPEHHYTLQEAADELGVDVAQIQLAIRANNLSCTPHFGRNLVPRSELESYRLRTQPDLTTPASSSLFPQGE